MPESNTLIQDRYRIDNYLGGGGFGDVYSAFDTVLLRHVAIKFIPYEGEQTLHEAQALARCSSPNVVEIHDVIEDGNQIGIVMEKVVFVPLDFDIIGNMDQKVFLDCFSQIIKAVKAVHSSGLLHLDLKPANILLTQQGHVKVSDFGLSTNKNTAATSHTSPSRGSWECLSPEQLLQTTVSEATDIFALGIILYTYLFKEHPFIAEGDIAATQKNIQSATLPAKHSLPCSLPELEQLVFLMLSKKQKKRPTLEQITSAIDSSNARYMISSAFSDTLDLPETSFFALHKKHLAMAFIVLLSGSGILIQQLSNTTSSTLVVPTIKINKEDQAKNAELSENAQFITAIIEDEIESAVINDPYRRLVNKKEWRGTLDWTQEAKQVDVDEIIISEADCGAEFCDINLSIYDRDDNNISRVSSKTIPYSDLLIFSHVIEQMLVSELNFSANNKSIANNISDDDLRTYYNFKKTLKEVEFEKRDLEKLQTFVESNPNFLGAHLLLGQAYRSLYRIRNESIWLKKSKKLTLSLKQKFPLNPSILYMDFKNQILSKDLKAAERTLHKLKRIIGIETTQLALSETMLAFSHDPVEGYESFLNQKNLRMTHNYFHYKAYMEESLRKYNDLEKTTQLWAKQFPDTYLPHFFQARAYFVIGRLKQAIKLFEKVIENHPNHDVILNIAICYFLLGNYPTSIEYLEQALEHSPNSPQVYLNLAEAHKAAGNADSKYFTKALELFNASDAGGINHAYKALILAHLNNPDKSIIELQKAAQQADKTGEFFLVAAYVHHILNQYEAALFNATEAGKKGFAPHWFNLPWTQSLYQRLNEKE